MAKRKVSNLLALAILSLLTERPMHPYEMLGVMRQRELAAVIKMNQSSLYSVIEALQREGWIVPTETRREGRYPERTVYATTADGRAELADWLRSLIRQPAIEYTAFAAALAFIGNLPPVEAAALLEEHARALQEQVSSTHSIIERGLHLGVDRLFLVEDAYTLTLQTARLTFVRQLISEINDGTLTEMSGEQRIWKMTHPELALLWNTAEKEQENPDALP
ncbi:MAG TPA: PadR family transcriptional regulator [Ktedonobacteraceae bacterium]|nr:PadR family transcriptional regulator [Ktedonobacteraceae bacterium]